MGIELPAELTDVAAQAGVRWPEADEEAMAKSAQAWRDAATSMSTVTTEADTTVRGALDAVRGDTGTAAAKHWQTFVEPDSGHLTSTVRGMNDAADRLEHASQQVGTAKVEIVRNLVSLAQNSDAAHSAAAAGHPTALAGLDTCIRGTSANVANIESNLINAVQPASGVDMSGVRDPVNANPGTHGPVSTLLSDTTALADNTVRGATDLAGSTTQGTTDLVGTAAHGTTDLVGNAAQGATDLVGNAAQGATDVVGGTVHGDSGHGHGGGAGVPVGDTVRGTTDLVGNTAQGATNLVGDAAHGATHVVGEPGHGVSGAAHPIAGPVSNVVGDVVHGGDPDITGPVPIDGFHDDRPTPPAGQTVQAGFGGVDVAAANPATSLPPAAPIVGGAPAPGAPNLGGSPGFGGAPVFGGPPGAPAPGGVGGGVGGPVGGPVGGAAPGGAPGAAARATPAAPVTGGPATGGPAPGVGTGRPGSGGATGGGPLAPRVGETGGRGGPIGETTSRPGPGVAPGPGARPGTGAPAGAPRPVEALLPEPRKGTYGAAPMAPAMPSTGGKERDEGLALFWVHMFPIGHMPVAADRPARQLPAPPPELDYAPGLRFEPGDHPQAELVDSAERRAALRDGVAPLEPSETLPADAPEVTALLEGHDPLGGENERDWDRRYLVRFGSVTAQGISREGVEFAWPPGEQYPEGGSADGEAEVLEEGTEIDRFGRWEGRVFAAEGTPFAQRSLPPAHLEHGYRRYRVLRPLPVWRAVSAAWFAQAGGGVRYRTTHSALELEALGYLADVTQDGSPEPTEETAK